MRAPSASPIRRSPRFLLALALAQAGGVIGYLPFLTLLLPLKVEGIAGEARMDVLTATVLAGAVASSTSNIAFGWLSDRAVARGGGRRRGIVFGLVLLLVAFAALAASETAAALTASVVLFQVAVNAVLAPLFALMADEVPDAQKGVAAGLLALGNPLASAFSALLVASALDEAARILTIPLVCLACVAPLLLTPARAGAASVTPAPSERSPRRDLLIAGVARLLAQVAGNVTALYLLYYFESVAPDTGSRVLGASIGHLLTLAYLVPLPIAVLIGRWSDATGRRKPFLLGAALVAAAGLVGMAAARGWSAGAIAFGVYATGSAVFLALHAGFAMQLLPDPRHRGRDLGLINLTNTLPALLGPALTWWLATPRDFSALMLSLAALTVGGGVLLLAARGRAQPGLPTQ